MSPKSAIARWIIALVPSRGNAAAWIRLGAVGLSILIVLAVVAEFMLRKKEHAPASSKPPRFTLPAEASPSRVELPTAAELEMSRTALEKLRTALAESNADQIPNVGGATEEEQWRQSTSAWKRRTMLEAYEKHGRRDPKWDDHAKAALEEDLRLSLDFQRSKNYYSVPSLKEQEGLRRLYQAAFSAGCDDPLVMYRHAVSVGSHDPWASLTASARAETNFPGSGYSRLLQFSFFLKRAELVASEFSGTTSGGSVSREEHLCLDLAIDHLVQGLAEEKLLPGEHRAIWRQAKMELETQRRGFVSLRWREALAPRVRGALRQQPQADPWLSRMLLGYDHYRMANDAWQLAKPEEGNKPEYIAQLTAARRYFLEAWSLHPEYPEPASFLVLIAGQAGGAAGESPKFWVVQAMKAEYDCRFAFDNLRINLQTDPAVDHQAWLALARELLATGRRDTTVPANYTLLLHTLGERFVPRRAVYQLPGVYEDHVRIAEEMQSSSPQTQRMCNSRLAMVAWLNGHDQQAKELVDKLGKDFDRGGVDFGVKTAELKASVADGIQAAQ